MKPIVLILVMGMVSLGLPAPTWADGMVPLRQGPVEPQVSEGEDAAEADLSQRILVQETLARQASVAFVTTTRGGTIPPPINPPIDPSDLNLPLPEGDPIPEDFDIEQEIIKAVIDYWMNRGIDVEELPITPMPLLPDHPPGPHHIGPDPSTEEAPPLPLHWTLHLVQWMRTATLLSQIHLTLTVLRHPLRRLRMTVLRHPLRRLRMRIRPHLLWRSREPEPSRWWPNEHPCPLNCDPSRLVRTSPSQSLLDFLQPMSDNQ